MQFIFNFFEIMWVFNDIYSLLLSKSFTLVHMSNTKLFTLASKSEIVKETLKQIFDLN